MKFLCDSCGTKYSIADDRVRGRVLKIRCKKCDFVITVREDVAAAGAGTDPAALPEPPADEHTLLGEMGPMATVPTFAPAPPSADDWFLSFDGEQEGPFALPRALQRLRANKDQKEVHAWRPGFRVWLPADEVPELTTKHEAARPMLPALPVRRPTGSMPVAAITKDPSGPRAALSVSAGARPTVPVAVRAPAIPVESRLEPASRAQIASMFDAPNSNDPPSLDGSALEPDDGDDDDDARSSPDLNISNEASGLVNLAHLAAASMGQKPAGPIFMNGHTARAPKLSPEPLAALDSHPNGSASVVVVAAGAPVSANPLFKYISFGTIPLLVGLVGVVGYLLTHRPAAETIIVTEPSRHVDDSTITMNDPNIARGLAPDPKHPFVGGKKPIAVGKGPTPAVAGKPTAENGAQQARNDLYREAGDEITPHAVPGIAGHPQQQDGQVSQGAIIAVVNSNKRMLSLCYERALKHDTSLRSGRVPIQVTVGMSGRVQSVTIPVAQYSSSELGQCFVQSVKRWGFPASDASYTTEFPFILQGQ